MFAPSDHNIVYLVSNVKCHEMGGTLANWIVDGCVFASADWTMLGHALYRERGLSRGSQNWLLSHQEEHSTQEVQGGQNEKRCLVGPLDIAHVARKTGGLILRKFATGLLTESMTE